MEKLLYSVAEYRGWATFIAFLLTGIESFIPVLPLVAIILANSIIFGMWKGFFISWSGSCVAAIMLYFCANKLSKLRIFNKSRNKYQDKKISTYINKQGFSVIFITYVCPFISDFFITVISGFINFDIKTFIIGMICGKFVMFLFISYVGKDIESFFRNPIKIILLMIFIAISWRIGKKVNNKIHRDNI